MSRWELADVLEEGVDAGNTVPEEVGGEVLRIQLSDEMGVRKEGLDFRAEEKRAAHMRVVEGLDAERVPSAEKLLPHGVPDHERKHAPQFRKERFTELFVTVDEHLGV